MGGLPPDANLFRGSDRLNTPVPPRGGGNRHVARKDLERETAARREIREGGTGETGAFPAPETDRDPRVLDERVQSLQPRVPQTGRMTSSGRPADIYEFDSPGLLSRGNREPGAVLGARRSSS